MELTPENVKIFLEDFKEKLLSQGNADQLALAFQEQNIRAVCCNAHECAIAQALHTAVEMEFNIDLPEAAVSVGHRLAVAIPGQYAEVYVDSGEQLRRFMNRFDYGLYSDLIDPEDTYGWGNARQLERAIAEAAPENLPDYLWNAHGIQPAA